MSLPADSTQPRLASGCRWGNSNGEDKMLLGHELNNPLAPVKSIAGSLKYPHPGNPR
jgi:hypothetical protein